MFSLDLEGVWKRLAWTRELRSEGWEHLHGVLPHEIVRDIDLLFHVPRGCDEFEW